MLKVDHIAFPIFDVEKSLLFYREFMGLFLADTLSGDDWGGYPWLMLLFETGDGGELALVHLRGAKRPAHDRFARDVRHLAFSGSAYTSLYPWQKKLKAWKIAWQEENRGSQKSLYFEDPNGITIEITTPPSTILKDMQSEEARVRRSRRALTAARRWQEGKRLLKRRDEKP